MGSAQILSELDVLSWGEGLPLDMVWTLFPVEKIGHQLSRNQGNAFLYLVLEGPSGICLCSGPARPPAQNACFLLLCCPQDGGSLDQVLKEAKRIPEEILGKVSIAVSVQVLLPLAIAALGVCACS